MKPSYTRSQGPSGTDADQWTTYDDQFALAGAWSQLFPPAASTGPHPEIASLAASAAAPDSVWYSEDPNFVAPAEPPEYVVSGGKWGLSTYGTGGGTVTWSIAGAGLTNQTGQTFFTGSTVALSSFLPSDYVAQITAAFARWSAVANIHFVQVADGGGDFGVGSVANIRIGGGYIDGYSASGSVVGRAFYPPSGTANAVPTNGDLVFDSGDAGHWNDALLYATALHEIGHTLGLGHSPQDNPVAVMNPTLHLGLDLQPDDIAGIQTIYGAPASGIGDNDFNGDRYSDLLFRNANGMFTEWQSTGNDFTPNVVVNATVSTAWHSEGAADFSGDGRSDLMWRNDANGMITIWNSTGTNFTANSAVINGVDPSWAVAALADFNGDGRSDILFRHVSGTFTEWQSTGSGFTANTYIQSVVDPTWHIVAAADFSGDGKADLLFRNNNGMFTEWQSTGSGFTANVYVDASVDPTWHIVGTGDFNGDGRADLLFRNNGGLFTEWQSTGSGFTSNVCALTGIDNSWSVAQISDFNGDGRDDLLFRNNFTGMFTEWQSVGNSFVPNVLVKSGVTTDWTIVTHHYDVV